MEWRCEWCGKPHEADDPPCENCGHGSFERAVVQEPAGGPAGESTTVWVCADCGREHTKHSPPCSRCGHPTLERREQTVDDDELVAPGYLDLVTPRYVLGLAAVLVFAAVLGLGIAGVVDLPGLGSEEVQVPDPAEVPGDPDAAAGVELADVEDAYLDRLNELRTGVGASAVTRADDLDDVARDLNLLFVDAEFGDAAPPGSEELGQLVRPVCGRDAVLERYDVDLDDGGTATGIGHRLAEGRVRQGGVDDAGDNDRVGIDAHAVDGAVYVFELTC